MLERIDEWLMPRSAAQWGGSLFLCIMVYRSSFGAWWAQVRRARRSGMEIYPPSFSYRCGMAASVAWFVLLIVKGLSNFFLGDVNLYPSALGVVLVFIHVSIIWKRDRRTLLNQILYLVAQLLFAWNGWIALRGQLESLPALGLGLLCALFGLFMAAFVNIPAYVLYRAFPKWKEES